MSSGAMERGFRSRLVIAVAAVSLPIMLAPPALGETLNEALASAYAGNPTLRAERARQRGTDELTPQALSGWRPTVTAQASAGPTNIRNNGVQGRFENKTTVPGQFEIVLSQPVFNGFETKFAVKSAEANVEAGRQNLLAVEQNILFLGTQAYMDVIRDRQILKLRQQNVGILREQLKATQERFNVGEVTRTDVAQAQASLALAESEVATAQSALAASIANYVQVIGHAPGSLKYPRVTKLPANLDDAITTAERLNPQVLAQAFVTEAARNQIGVERAGLLPKVSVQASALAQSPDLLSQPNEETYSLLGVVTIPLYEAGQVYSAVRQAKQAASQARVQIIEVQRAVRNTVVTAWNALEAARQVIVAARAQVSANELALEGVRQEYQVGTRTTLDVLQTVATLLLSRETLVIAEHDQVVDAYQLIAATGRLTAHDLGLGAPIYDPVENYRKVRDKWFGTGVDTVD